MNLVLFDMAGGSKRFWPLSSISRVECGTAVQVLGVAECDRFSIPDDDSIICIRFLPGFYRNDFYFVRALDYMIYFEEAS